MRLFRRKPRIKKSSLNRNRRRRQFSFEFLERRELLWAGAEFYLAYDSGASDSDMITYDSTVEGTVDWDSPDTFEATVEFDHDGDGSAEGSAMAYSAGESIEYNPAWIDAMFDEYEGEVNLAYRVVEHTPYGDIENDWESFDFTFDNVAPTVLNMNPDDCELLTEVPAQISIEFSEAIDADNLTQWDIFVDYGEGGQPGQTLEVTGDNTVEITFTNTLIDGNYVTTMQYVTDLAGNSNYESVYANWTVDAAIEYDPEVISVQFIPMEADGYGELQLDTNPSGGEGQLDFKGGHRFFPGAKSLQANTKGQNIVRVKATISGATDADIGTMVLFRSFDVDDPSDADSKVAPDQPAKDIIDPNGDSARDNRGRLEQLNFDAPTPNDAGKPDESEKAEAQGAGGDSGYLRPIDAIGDAGVWQSRPGGKTTAEAPIRKVGNDYIAEVDLATSYAPGDNCRVGAALTNEEKAGLQSRDPNTVPAADPANQADPHFTKQLSVWRRFQIEQDRMATVQSADKVAGSVAAPATGTTGTATITTDITEMNGLSIAANQFGDGGILRHGGQNYHVLSNTAGNSGSPMTITVIADAAAFSAGSMVTVYEDDFSSIGSIPGASPLTFITLSAAPAGAGGTQMTATPNDFPMTPGSLVGGYIHSAAGDAYFPITANTADTITFDIGGNAAPTGLNYNLYWPLGSNEPQTIVDPSTDDGGLYDLLQETADFSQNRYAQAYLEPELDRLNSLDSNDDEWPATFVTSSPHVDELNQTQTELANVVGSSRGSDTVETDVFWVVYATTGFEAASTRDGDPGNEHANPGVVLGLTNLGRDFSMIFLETIRDSDLSQLSDPGESTPARLMVHEIGHQFDLATPDTPGVSTDGQFHRNGSGNIMHEIPVSSNFSFDEFVFHAYEIDHIRMRHQSPGTEQ